MEITPGSSDVIKWLRCCSADTNKPFVLMEEAGTGALKGDDDGGGGGGGPGDRLSSAGDHHHYHWLEKCSSDMQGNKFLAITNTHLVRRTYYQT